MKPFRSPFYRPLPEAITLRWLLYPPGFPGIYLRSVLPIL